MTCPELPLVLELFNVFIRQQVWAKGPETRASGPTKIGEAESYSNRFVIGEGADMCIS